MLTDTTDEDRRAALIAALEYKLEQARKDIAALNARLFEAIAVLIQLNLAVREPDI